MGLQCNKHHSGYNTYKNTVLVVALLMKVEKNLIAQFVLKFLDMKNVVKMAILSEFIYLVIVDSRHLFV